MEISPGDLIGTYEVLEPVGKPGGQGAVFRCRVISDRMELRLSKGDTVAVKVMESYRRRGQRFEVVQTLRGIRHQNIVGYHDHFRFHAGGFGECECVVMEYLEGETLEEKFGARNKEQSRRYSDEERKIRPHFLPWSETQQILKGCLAGLIEGVKVGILHRDIKPSNIFCCSDGTVKLIDWGLAYLPGGSIETSGELKGSFDYKAPDYLIESFQHGDEISEIFSLGVVICEALEGSLPFERLDPGNQHIGYVRRWRMDGLWPVPTIPRAVSGLNIEGREFIEKMVSPDRESRYQSFFETNLALESIKRRKIESGQSKLSGNRAEIQYEFGDLISWGGFGDVFKGTRLYDNRDVAIKRVHLGADRQGLARSRFLREARILKNLGRHPHIVEYLDLIDLRKTGEIFLILEYLPGMPAWSLSGRLKQQLMTPLEASEYFVSYLKGLEGLHTGVSDNKEGLRGIVHRDIKPSNLYAPVSAPENGKVFDLGIARIQTGSHSLGGRVPGTPGYIAPELLKAGKGKEDRGSPYSDIYGLGLCLFQSVVGRLPFGSLPTDSAKAFAELVRRFEIRPNVKNELEKYEVFKRNQSFASIVAKALEWEPKHRFSSAKSMREALESFIEEIGPVVEGRILESLYGKGLYKVGNFGFRGLRADLYSGVRLTDGAPVTLKRIRGSSKEIQTYCKQLIQRYETHQNRKYSGEYIDIASESNEGLSRYIVFSIENAWEKSLDSLIKNEKWVFNDFFVPFFDYILKIISEIKDFDLHLHPINIIVENSNTTSIKIVELDCNGDISGWPLDCLSDLIFSKKIENAKGKCQKVFFEINKIFQFQKIRSFENRNFEILVDQKERFVKNIAILLLFSINKGLGELIPADICKGSYSKKFFDKEVNRLILQSKEIGSNQVSALIEKSLRSEFSTLKTFSFELNRFLGKSKRPEGPKIIKSEESGFEYKIENFLGRGAQGDVFSGIRIQDLTSVAIKCTRSCNPRSMAGLERERNVLRRIRHNNIVRYIDYIYPNEIDSTGYLIIERLGSTKCETLRERIDQEGSINPLEAKELFENLLKAMVYLHLQNDENGKPILHCDIKPGNIFVPKGRPENVKLFDFGIAEFNVELPYRKELIGTLQYMAPELLKPRFRGAGLEWIIKNASPQSDIYALGLVIFESITGEHPFGLRSIEDGAVIEEIFKCSRNLKKILFNYPVFSIYPGLKPFIEKALDPKPKNRYGDVANMLKAWSSAFKNFEDSKRISTCGPAIFFHGISEVKSPKTGMLYKLSTVVSDRTGGSALISTIDNGEKKFLVRMVSLSGMSPSERIQITSIFDAFIRDHGHSLVGCYDYAFADGFEDYLFYLTEQIGDSSSCLTLRQCLSNKGNLSIKEAIPLFLELLKTINFFHLNEKPPINSIFHCGLYPENICFPKVENKILNLIHFVFKSKESNQNLAKDDEGVSLYIAPEFFTKGSAGYCVQSDLYSLALCLYEALTGIHPFLIGKKTKFFVKKNHKNPFRKRSGISFSFQVFKLYPELERIIKKSLASNPNHRQNSAVEMLQDLERFWGQISHPGETVELVPSIWPIVKKRAIISFAVSGFTLGLVFGSNYFALWMYSRKLDRVEKFLSDQTLSESFGTEREIQIRDFLLSGEIYPKKFQKAFFWSAKNWTYCRDRHEATKNLYKNGIASVNFKKFSNNEFNEFLFVLEEFEVGQNKIDSIIENFRLRNKSEKRFSDFLFSLENNKPLKNIEIPENIKFSGIEAKINRNKNVILQWVKSVKIDNQEEGEMWEKIGDVLQSENNFPDWKSIWKACIKYLTHIEALVSNMPEDVSNMPEDVSNIRNIYNRLNFKEEFEEEKIDEEIDCQIFPDEENTNKYESASFTIAFNDYNSSDENRIDLPLLPPKKGSLKLYTELPDSNIEGFLEYSRDGEQAVSVSLKNLNENENPTTIEPEPSEYNLEPKTRGYAVPQFKRKIGNGESLEWVANDTQKSIQDFLDSENNEEIPTEYEVSKISPDQEAKQQKFLNEFPDIRRSYFRHKFKEEQFDNSQWKEKFDNSQWKEWIEFSSGQNNGNLNTLEGKIKNENQDGNFKIELFFIWIEKTDRPIISNSCPFDQQLFICSAKYDPVSFSYAFLSRMERESDDDRYSYYLKPWLEFIISAYPIETEGKVNNEIDDLLSLFKEVAEDKENFGIWIEKIKDYCEPKAKALNYSEEAIKEFEKNVEFCGKILEFLD